MHIDRRRLNPGTRASPTASASCAGRAPSSRTPSATHQPDAPIRELEEGGAVVVPASGVDEPRSRRGPSAAARPCAARQQGVRRRRQHPAPARRRSGGSGAEAGQRRRRGRFPLRPVARRIPRPLPRGSRTARPGQAAHGDDEGEGLRRAGYSTAGSPANLAIGAHHAQRACAAHRAESPAPGRDRGAAGAKSRRRKGAATAPTTSRRCRSAFPCCAAVRW